MDRREAIQELTQWRDQMKSHGVPNYGKKLTALDLAIQALVLQDKHIKAVERMIEGVKEINRFLEEAAKKSDEKLQLSGETSTNEGETSTISEKESVEGDAESATTTDCNYTCSDCKHQDKTYEQEPCHSCFNNDGAGYEPDTDCISRADTIKAMCQECKVFPDDEVNCADCTEVAIVSGMPPVNQKQVTSKLNNPDDSLVTEDSEACKEQKSKLDCISREQAIEAVKNICNTPCNEYFVKAIESIPPTDTVSRDEMAEVTDMNTRLKNEIEYLQMLLATKSEHLLDDETIICSPKIADKVMEALQEKPSGDMVSIADAIAAVDKVVGFSKIERQRVKEELNALPPVTPTERTGEWEHDGSDWENRWVCSECGYKLFEEQTTYCGNCGAKMKGGTENE